MNAFMERMDAQERRLDTVGRNLESHVKECAAIQKRVLVVGSLTLGWVVGHAPESISLFKKLLEVLP